MNDRVAQLERLLAQCSEEEVLFAIGKKLPVKTRPMASKVVYSIEVRRGRGAPGRDAEPHPPRRGRAPKARLPGLPAGNPYGLTVQNPKIDRVA